jgi:hypothetical protein
MTCLRVKEFSRVSRPLARGEVEILATHQAKQVRIVGGLSASQGVSGHRRRNLIWLTKSSGAGSCAGPP